MRGPRDSAWRGIRAPGHRRCQSGSGECVTVSGRCRHEGRRRRSRVTAWAGERFVILTAVPGCVPVTLSVMRTNRVEKSVRCGHVVSDAGAQSSRRCRWQNPTRTGLHTHMHTHARSHAHTHAREAGPLPTAPASCEPQLRPHPGVARPQPLFLCVSRLRPA